MSAFVHLIELPVGITPEMLGVTVGAVTAILVFAIIAFVVAARERRAHAAHAGEVVLVPPYSALGSPGASPDATRPPPAQYARMGFAFGERLEMVRATLTAPAAVPATPVATGMATPIAPAPAPIPTPVMATRPSAVQVSPVVVISAPPRPRDEDSAPHPLGVIPASSSAMMRAAPISDLAFDDGPTEFCEPYFDEPPQPVSRPER